jgi:sialic acid synthase SpsE
MEQRRDVPEGSYEILAWPFDWVIDIACYARNANVEFMCTVFLPGDVATMNPYVERWKVASLENNYDEMIREMILTKKEVIASHGATGTGIGAAHWSHYALHCTAAYPAPLNELNLRAIQCGYEGYSDHSRNVLTGAIAVACGAEIVEVHFKLHDTPTGNPDSGHSLWPEQLAAYIDNIRMAELMLGDGVKKIMPCEEWALKHKVKA